MCAHRTPHTATRFTSGSFPLLSITITITIQQSVLNGFTRENHEFEFVRVRFNGIEGFNVMACRVQCASGVWSLESLEVRRESSAVLGGRHDSVFFSFFSPSVARRASGKVTVPYGNVEVTYARAEMKAK